MAKKINARFIIQIAGKPVENVQKALEVIVDKIKESKDYKVLESEIIEPELDDKTTLYSGLIELSIKFENAQDILGFIVDFTPNSVEIEEPEEITMDNNELTAILNDMSSKLLESQTKIRQLNAYVHMQNQKLAGFEKK